jgi:hypothetical protein
MNAINNYLFKYITLKNSILFENQGVTLGRGPVMTTTALQVGGTTLSSEYWLAQLEQRGGNASSATASVRRGQAARSANGVVGKRRDGAGLQRPRLQRPIQCCYASSMSGKHKHEKTTTRSMEGSRGKDAA